MSGYQEVKRRSKKMLPEKRRYWKRIPQLKECSVSLMRLDEKTIRRHLHSPVKRCYIHYLDSARLERKFANFTHTSMENLTKMSLFFKGDIKAFISYRLFLEEMREKRRRQKEKERRRRQKERRRKREEEKSNRKYDFLCDRRVADTLKREAMKDVLRVRLVDVLSDRSKRRVVLNSRCVASDSDANSLAFETLPSPVCVDRARTESAEKTESFPTFQELPDQNLERRDDVNLKCARVCAKENQLLRTVVSSTLLDLISHIDQEQVVVAAGTEAVGADSCGKSISPQSPAVLLVSSNSPLLNGSSDSTGMVSDDKYYDCPTVASQLSENGFQSREKCVLQSEIDANSPSKKGGISRFDDASLPDEEVSFLSKGEVIFPQSEDKESGLSPLTASQSKGSSDESQPAKDTSFLYEEEHVPQSPVGCSLLQSGRFCPKEDVAISQSVDNTDVLQSVEVSPQKDVPSTQFVGKTDMLLLGKLSPPENACISQSVDSTDTVLHSGGASPREDADDSHSVDSTDLQQSGGVAASQSADRTVMLQLSVVSPREDDVVSQSVEGVDLVRSGIVSSGADVSASQSADRTVVLQTGEIASQEDVSISQSVDRTNFLQFATVSPVRSADKTDLSQSNAANSHFVDRTDVFESSEVCSREDVVVSQSAVDRANLLQSGGESVTAPGSSDENDLLQFRKDVSASDSANRTRILQSDEVVSCIPRDSISQKPDDAVQRANQKNEVLQFEIVGSSPREDIADPHFKDSCGSLYLQDGAISREDDISVLSKHKNGVFESAKDSLLSDESGAAPQSDDNLESVENTSFLSQANVVFPRSAVRCSMLQLAQIASQQAERYGDVHSTSEHDSLHSRVVDYFSQDDASQSNDENTLKEIKEDVSQSSDVTSGITFFSQKNASVSQSNDENSTVKGIFAQDVISQSSNENNNITFFSKESDAPSHSNDENDSVRDVFFSPADDSASESCIEIQNEPKGESCFLPQEGVIVSTSVEKRPSTPEEDFASRQLIHVLEKHSADMSMDTEPQKVSLSFEEKGPSTPEEQVEPEEIIYLLHRHSAHIPHHMDEDFALPQSEEKDPSTPEEHAVPSQVVYVLQKHSANFLQPIVIESQKDTPFLQSEERGPSTPEELVGSDQVVYVLQQRTAPFSQSMGVECEANSPLSQSEERGPSTPEEHVVPEQVIYFVQEHSADMDNIHGSQPMDIESREVSPLSQCQERGPSTPEEHVVPEEVVCFLPKPMDLRTSKTLGRLSQPMDVEPQDYSISHSEGESQVRRRLAAPSTPPTPSPSEDELQSSEDEGIFLSDVRQSGSDVLRPRGEATPSPSLALGGSESGPDSEITLSQVRADYDPFAKEFFRYMDGTPWPKDEGVDSVEAGITQILVCHIKDSAKLLGQNDVCTLPEEEGPVPNARMVDRTLHENESKWPSMIGTEPWLAPEDPRQSALGLAVLTALNS